MSKLERVLALTAYDLNKILKEQLTNKVSRDLLYEIKNAAHEATKNGNTYAFLNLIDHNEIEFIKQLLREELELEGFTISDVSRVEPTFKYQIRIDW